MSILGILALLSCALLCLTKKIGWQSRAAFYLMIGSSACFIIDAILDRSLFWFVVWSIILGLEYRNYRQLWS